MPVPYTPGAIADLISDYRTAKNEYMRFEKQILGGGEEGLTHATGIEAKFQEINLKEAFDKFKSAHENAAEFLKEYPDSVRSYPGLKPLKDDVEKDASTFIGPVHETPEDTDTAPRRPRLK